MLNLFGDDAPEPLAMSRKAPAPIAVDLFTAAAERAAYVTGRSVSQERLELAGYVTPAAQDDALPIA